MVVWVEEVAYLTAEEACALLGVKRRTLYAYVSRGVVASVRQGRRRRRLYARREIERVVRLAPSRERRPARVGLPSAEEWIGDD